MLTKVDLAAMAGSDEDAEKMVEEFLKQIRAELNEARHAAATSMADETRLRARYERYRSDTETWEQKAELAVRNGDDDLAREALRKKMQARRLADNYQALWSAEHDEVEDLRAALAGLEAKIEEAEEHRESIIARTRRAHNMVASVEEADVRDDELREKFARLESDTAVERELTELKERVGKE